MKCRRTTVTKLSGSSQPHACARTPQLLEQSNHSSLVTDTVCVPKRVTSIVGRPEGSLPPVFPIPDRAVCQERSSTMPIKMLFLRPRMPLPCLPASSRRIEYTVVYRCVKRRDEMDFIF